MSPNLTITDEIGFRVPASIKVCSVDTKAQVWFWTGKACAIGGYTSQRQHSM